MSSLRSGAPRSLALQETLEKEIQIRGGGFRPSKSSREILARFPDERRRFLDDVIREARRAAGLPASRIGRPGWMSHLRFGCLAEVLLARTLERASGPGQAGGEAS